MANLAEQKAVSGNSMIGSVVAVIQNELQGNVKLIEQLETENANLRAEVESLTKELAELKKPTTGKGKK